MTIIKYSYKHVPTIALFSKDDTLIRGLMGPMGSGKSVGGGVIELIQRAQKQKPGPDGIKRTRFAVVRNTTPQLIDTTIKTFLEWVPNGIFGTYKENPRPQYIIDKLNAPDGTPVHCEVIFRALDKPDQVRDLLSLELTGAWFNEFREIAKAIFDPMTGRIHRYPKKDDGGPTWSGIWGDFNPCDTDHWLYELLMIEKPAKCATCKNSQGGMVLYPSRDINNNILPEDQRFCPQCGKDHTNSFPLTVLYRQPSARSPQAENLPNLDPNYYPTLMMGKSFDFIKVYVDGDWGHVGEGKWVYLNWVSTLHIAEQEIPVVRGLPLIVGLDFGMNPAAVICQSFPDGRFNVIDELVSKDIVLREFIVRFLKPYLNQKYMGMDVVITGDPSGVSRSQSDGNTCYRELKAQGLTATPAPSNALSARIGAVNSLLTKPLKNIGSNDSPNMKMPFQVSPKCKTLIRGFNGSYYRKRVSIIGKDMFRDEPEKTFESHIHDALQYAAMLAEVSGIIPIKHMTRMHQHLRGISMSAPPIGAFV